MTALSEVSNSAGHAADGLLTTSRAQILRGRLLTGMDDWTAQFGRDLATFAALTAEPSEDPTGFDRAMAALGMYAAIEAIEQIEDALVRITDQRYGICQSCDRPIPIERLEAIPQTRFCAACPASAAPQRSRVPN